MKRFIFFFFLSILLAGCYNESPELTKFDMTKVISQEKMTAIMVDIQLVEGGFLVKQRARVDGSDVIAREYFMLLLEQHGISEEEFDESIKYYAYNTELLDEVYEETIIQLTKLEIEVSRKDTVN